MTDLSVDQIDAPVRRLGEILVSSCVGIQCSETRTSITRETENGYVQGVTGLQSPARFLSLEV